jgi:small subunit ribosomal protein S16
METQIGGLEQNRPVISDEILLGNVPSIVQFPAPPARLRAFRTRNTDMAVALRLNRQGTTDRPYYKIVAVDSRKRRDGRYIEQIGTYDPLKEGVNYTIDLEAAQKWLSQGAQASETVASIVRKARTAVTTATAATAE